MLLKPASSTTSPTPVKRPRLSTSCNWCRAHKMKCDTQQPSCSNCNRRGTKCVTTNLRKPGSVGRRVEPAGRHRKRRSHLSTYPEENWTASTSETQSITQTSSGSDGHPEKSPEANTASGSRANIPRETGTSSNSLPVVSLPFNIFGQMVGPNEVHGLGNGMYIDDQSSHGTSSLSLNGATTSDSEEVSISPGTDLTILTDNSPDRLQIMGSSSSLYILAQWLDLFFAQRPDWHPIFPDFRYGMAYTVEMPLPFPVPLPPIPTSEEQGEYISIFSVKIQPIFPILDIEAFRASVPGLAAKMESNPASLSPADYPLLACAYAVFSVSADEKHGYITDAGTRYLEAAYFLHAHLLAIPYVNSVQALLLLTIVLRCRNKDGASWSTLGQAIRIAQSIGLHRIIARPGINVEAPESPPTFTKETSLHSRIWWTAYCLEGIMELETGRPSAIQDFECDQVLPPSNIQSHQKPGGFDFFKALIDLVKLQRQISDRLYRKKPLRRQTEQLLHDTATLDLALLDWADRLPEGIRPGRDIFWDPQQLHLSTFLSLHFHQTIIALHRPALMSGSAWLNERVILYNCSGEAPGRYRLRYSPCICASSARSIVKAMSDLIYARRHSQLITVAQVMLAMFVLGIYISRTHSSWMNESDLAASFLALLINVSEYAEKQYTQMGQHPEFIKGCVVLRTQISDHVHGLKAASHLASGSRTMIQKPVPSLQQSNEDLAVPNNYSEEFLADINLDELWPYLWGDDLSQVYLGGTELDLINTHLLGLPQTGPF